MPSFHQKKKKNSNDALGKKSSVFDRFPCLKWWLPVGGLTCDLALVLSMQCVFLFCLCHLCQCSRSCAGGVQRRAVVCQDEDGHSASYCDAASKPPESNHCGSGPCPHWNFGDWGEVSHAVLQCHLGMTWKQPASCCWALWDHLISLFLCGNRFLKVLLQEVLWFRENLPERACTVLFDKTWCAANRCMHYHCLSKSGHKATYTS